MAKENELRVREIMLKAQVIRQAKILRKKQGRRSDVPTRPRANLSRRPRIIEVDPPNDEELAIVACSTTRSALVDRTESNRLTTFERVALRDTEHILSRIATICKSEVLGCSGGGHK